MGSIALNKRAPEMDQELFGRYAKISKADWADLYFDALRQLYGESMTDEEIMQDAENRLEVLKCYRAK
jgi:hypothetical protein